MTQVSDNMCYKNGTSGVYRCLLLFCTCVGGVDVYKWANSPKIPNDDAGKRMPNVWAIPGSMPTFSQKCGRKSN